MWQQSWLPRQQNPHPLSLVIESLADARVEILIDGYRFLKSEMEPDGIDENVEQDKALWRTVWSLQIPNKMKILMRRACRNSLPTKEILVRRTIIDNPICDRCKVEPETALHALWSCSELDVVWEDASTWSCRGNTSLMDFKELMSWLIKQNHHLELFSAIAWSIWSHRNRVRMLQPSCNPNQLATLAKELLSKFMAAQPPPRIQPTSTCTRCQGPGFRV
ncbi:hypothetical protein SO802_008509 [Lithocarpus litseifolius]|uniref:Reverse transcriptase zinc-binding domain-containing protein n=1 Tax=Lithocarpus litseifolius TaxID=425828 RepID=A0AAW2DAZ8_9ROSI